VNADSATDERKVGKGYILGELFVSSYVPGTSIHQARLA
jgi:hypothetical protein